MPLLEMKGIVLNVLRLGEGHKLITFLTDSRGKVKGVARGARKPRSRFGAALEPFTHCHLILFEKRPTILLRLNQADIIHSFYRIRDDLEKIIVAARMVKVVTALVPEGEANPRVFNLLLAGLDQVNRTQNGERGAKLEWLLRAFEIRCLKHAGYQARWDRCLRCLKDVGNRMVYFSPRNGGAICGVCSQSTGNSLQPISPPSLAMMRLMSRMNWDGLLRFKVSPKMLKEVRGIMEAHLTYILERPLKQISLGRTNG